MAVRGVECCSASGLFPELTSFIPPYLTSHINLPYLVISDKQWLQSIPGVDAVQSGKKAALHVELHLFRAFDAEHIHEYILISSFSTRRLINVFESCKDNFIERSKTSLPPTCILCSCQTTHLSVSWPLQKWFAWKSHEETPWNIMNQSKNRKILLPWRWFR